MKYANGKKINEMLRVYLIYYYYHVEHNIKNE